MMDLNDHSSRFLTELLRAFPEFAGRATAGPEEGYFTLVFPTSSGAMAWVSTEFCDRITVGCGSDGQHVHFGGWSDSVDAEDFRSAVNHIRRLVHGDECV
jgi:hypothetical protein